MTPLKRLLAGDFILRFYIPSVVAAIILWFTFPFLLSVFIIGDIIFLFLYYTYKITEEDLRKRGE